MTSPLEPPVDEEAIQGRTLDALEQAGFTRESSEAALRSGDITLLERVPMTSRSTATSLTGNAGCETLEVEMTAFDQAWTAIGGQTAEENPGYRLVLNRQHFTAMAKDSPLSPWADLESLRVFGYPIRLDETVTEMRLELA